MTTKELKNHITKFPIGYYKIIIQDLLREIEAQKEKIKKLEKTINGYYKKSIIKGGKNR